MKQQTSVDWLIDEIESLKVETVHAGNELQSVKVLDSTKEQAKAKFKDQISRAYFMGLIDGGNHNPQDYFKNTYEDETSI